MHLLHPLFGCETCNFCGKIPKFEFNRILKHLRCSCGNGGPWSDTMSGARKLWNEHVNWFKELRKNG